MYTMCKYTVCVCVESYSVYWYSTNDVRVALSVCLCAPIGIIR